VLRWRDVVRYAGAKPEKPFFKDHFYAQQPRPFSPAIETKPSGFGPRYLRRLERPDRRAIGL
jgi:hypothetical protein